ncbi:MAG TPA: hypothetical protein VH595_01110 [Verrucomicrobiae bacterium]|jgi:hypothetical protein|nr:hypothetical protein [Verrucomicrobiae bacterium]
MRMILWLSVFLSAAISTMAAQAGPVAASYHCAGTAELKTETNLKTLNKILASPNSVTFREFALGRIAGLLSQSWGLETNSSLIAPLLADCLEKESCAVVGGPDSKTEEFILAVHLDGQRSQIWRETLAKAFGGAGEQFTTGQFIGRRWVKATPGVFWMIPAQGWFLFGRGENLGSVQARYLREISEHGRPVPPLAGNWLESDLDLTASGAFVPDWTKLLKPAKVHISVAPGPDVLEINAKADYPSAIPWNLKPWKLPKQLVQEPLVSFTAGLDLGAFLRISPEFSKFDANPLTNQFCAWAMSQMPLQSYLAWPVSNGTNAVAELSTELPSVLDPILQKFNRTQILSQPGKARLVLSDLRVVAPAIEPAQDHGDFLLLSLFPRVPFARQAPDHLWGELMEHSNLVYYDWEMTGPRLQQWRLLSGILWHNSPATATGTEEGLLMKSKLFGDFGKEIGKTVTEITLSTPNQVSIVRRGPLGFTGLEMVLIVDWMTIDF